MLRTLIDNPVASYREQAYAEAISRTNVMGQNLWIVADPQTFQDVLLTYETDFPKAPIEHRLLEAMVGKGLLTTEGAVWKRQRRAAAPTFRHTALKALVPEMDRAGATAAERLVSAAGSTRNVLQEMALATLDIIQTTLLSNRDGHFDSDLVARDVACMLQTYGGPDLFDVLGLPSGFPRPWGGKGRRATARMRALAREAIAQQQARAGSDTTGLLPMLMNAEDPETGTALTDQEIEDNIMTFIGAGFETTSLALTWTLYLLAGHADWQNRLAEEVRSVCGDGAVTADHLEKLVLHEQVLNESMRLYPPVPTIGRVALRTMDLSNISVQKGDIVLLGFMPMHRSSLWWDNAHSFDPTRFSPGTADSRHRFQFVPFSGGPRICIGARFAMMEAKAILANIVRRVAVGLPDGFTPQIKSRITLQPVGGMPLVISRR